MTPTTSSNFIVKGEGGKLWGSRTSVLMLVQIRCYWAHFSGQHCQLEGLYLLRNRPQTTHRIKKGWPKPSFFIYLHDTSIANAVGSISLYYFTLLVDFVEVATYHKVTLVFKESETTRGLGNGGFSGGLSRVDYHFHLFSWHIYKPNSAMISFFVGSIHLFYFILFF